jgi:ProP effector
MNKSRFIKKVLSKKEERISAAWVVLNEFWPKAFNAERPPLKIGIHIDLIAALDGALTPHEIAAALGAWCAHGCYLENASVAGKQRIDLDGNAAGTVTAEQAAYARSILDERETEEAEARLEAHRRNRAEALGKQNQ